MLTLVADKCPYRRQNEDYANYLLTTLYHEAKNMEEWESEMTEEDYANFKWDKTRSKENILAALSKIENKSAESLLESKKVDRYRNNLKKVFDEGESQENLNAYKKSVLEILDLKQAVRLS